MIKVIRPETKKEINNAFKQLRKLGFVARQNFWCCQTCATSALTQAPYNLKDGDKFVFYHNQDAQNLKFYGRCHLAFGATVEDGKVIARIFQEQGLKVTWDETMDHRIEIEQK